MLARSGDLEEDALAAAREAGVTDAELTEVVAHVALKVMSSSFNHLARPDLDFPDVA